MKSCQPQADSGHTAVHGVVAPDELISRANKLGSLLRQRQDRAEADRRVSDEVFDQIADDELNKILLPKRYGGFEHGLDTFAKVAFELGRG